MKELVLTSLAPEVLKLNQRIFQFHGAWKASAAAERTFYSSLRKTVIITSAGASTRIEGAKLSDAMPNLIFPNTPSARYIR